MFLLPTIAANVTAFYSSFPYKYIHKNIWYFKICRKIWEKPRGKWRI